MTFSVGFRAPAEADIVSHFADHVCAELTEDSRYSDGDTSDAQAEPALVDDHAIARIQAILNKHTQNPDALKAWFAQYMTESKYDTLHEPLEDELEWGELAPFFTQASNVIQNETTRWAYYETALGTSLVINGEVTQSLQAGPSRTMAKMLANQRQTNTQALIPYLEDNQCQQILLNLFNLNYLYFDEA